MKKHKEIILIGTTGVIRNFRLNRFASILISSLVIFLYGSFAAFGLLTTARVSNRLFVAWSAYKAEQIQKQFGEITAYTRSLEKRMDSLFAADDERRDISGADPIKSEVREVGIGGPSTLADYEKIFLFQDDLERRVLEERIDKLLRQSELQMYSLNEFEDFFTKKKYALDHIPAVQPTEGSFLSGFGMRLHPVFHTRRMHKGVDISNTIGTPVMASAQATAKTGVSETFGSYVLLDHHNGYTTIYAHLSSVVIRNNQPIERGQVIGYLGNSGLSTGPHLHYEVHLNRIPVDPNPYLLPEEYIVD